MSERLQLLTETLAAARVQDEVFEVVLTSALQALDAVAGAVLLVDETGARLNLAATQGHQEGAQALWQGGPMGGNVPAGDAIAQHQPLFFEQRGDLTRAYPELEACTGGVAAIATAVSPMFLDEQALGVIILDFKEPHEFTQEEIRFLRTLAAQCALALGRARLSQDLERRVQERTAELEEERAALAAFARFTEASTHLTDPHTFAREAGLVLCDLLDVHVAYSELEDGLWKGQVFFEDTPPQVTLAARVGFPAELPNFARPFQERDVVFVDGWHGEQEGAEVTGVYTAAALYPYFEDGRPHGLLTMGSLHASVWTERERSVFRSVGRSLALALERVEHARRIEEGARAQEAFMAFTEAVGTELDVLVLAQRAVDVLQAHFVDGIGGYYEREGELWKLRSWTRNLDVQPDFIATLQAGLPSDTPFIADLLRERTPVFTESWDAEHEGIEDSEDYGAVAAYPVMVGGEVRGFFTMGFKTVSRWAERDRAIFRAVGHGLTLATERAEQARQLQARNDEEARRSQALAAFAELSRDLVLETDPLVLIRRTQEVVLGLLPPGFSLYYEPRGGWWHLTSQVGRANTPELQGALDAGFAFEVGTNMLIPYRSGEPHFQDEYDPATDQLTGSDEYPGATAVLPVVVNGQSRGVVGFALSKVRSWSREDRAVLETVGRQLTLALERAEQTRRLATQNAELEARTLALERFADLARSQESEAATLIRQAQEAAFDLIGEGFSVYFELDGNAWRLKSQVGSPGDETIQASLESALPYETVRNYRIPWESGTPFYQDAYDRALDHGVPGTEALASTAALPLFVGTRRQGMFGYGLKVSRAWTRADRATLETAVTSLGLSLERAEQTRALEEEREALAAFARFTEGSTRTTDALTLAQGAKDVLRATLGVEVGYSELEDGLWKGRVFSETTPPGVVAQSKRGFPADLPAFARPFEEGDVVFVDGWDPQGAEHTEVYGAAALYPYFQGGQPHGLLTMGTSVARAWTERERSVFRSVGRSLALAFERAEQARQLQVQNAELEARTRALEGFASLAQDLTADDPRAFVRRAQEVVLSLLPPGYALYYEREGDRWRNRVQVGSTGNADLQAFIDAGPPVGVTPSVDVPWTTKEPFYQDDYVRGSDTPAEMVQHVNTIACLPILRHGEVVGVLIAVLFEARTFTPTDKVVLETVARSLGGALERVEATRALTTTQLRLRAVVDNAPVVLFALDRQGTFTLSEGRGLSGLGLQPGEAVGRSAFDLYRNTPELLDDLRLALKGQEVHQTRRIGGRVFENWSIPVQDDSGVVTDIVGVSTDVTERQQAEENLGRRNEELRRSNAELEQFAYIASHDLQAPIRAVSSFAGVIDKRYGSQLDERGRLYLRQIVESGEHMKRLVDDLLAFSRVHTEQRPLRFTDSEAVFDAVLKRLQPEIERTGASVTRGELPQVVADPQQLDQLLQNLVSNGLKYRREGVTSEVKVSAQREGRVWRFAVQDNGIGIEPQYFERIFVIFQRLHGREEYEGTGIGLAVCKKIVERHAGRLWLESTPGEGTTFFFTLPAG